MPKYSRGSIRQQLAATVMATVGIALLIASAAFVTYETFAYCRALRRDLGVRADLVEASSTTALTFEDAAQAEAALMPLKGQSDILAASLFLENGTFLAGFPQSTGARPELVAGADSLGLAGGRLLMVRSIHLHGQKIGTLCLTADLGGLHREFLWGAVTTLFLAGLSFLLAFGFTQRMQKGLALPLAELAFAAKSVARKHDYGIRVRPSGHNELGRLMADFNEMLAQIQQRDQELHAHRERLEDLVQARTVQLQQDMAEKKSLEKQFLRAQRMESLGTLAGGVAHDLNNVLAPIILSIQSLGQSATDARSRKILAIIEGSANRGRDIVRQILAFSRGIEGEKACLDLPLLTQELEAIIRQTFPKAIAVKTSVAPDLAGAVGDATQIHQLLLNLCVNARDAMALGGELTLDLRNADVTDAQAKLRLDAKAGSYVVITVSDTGCGMGPQTLDRMFEPFFTTKDKGKGTGLGLSSVHTIARSHGGFLRCKSEVGRGTSFQVFLPASASPVPPAPAAGPAPVRRRGGGEWVLVVDDEAFVREITRHALETFGFQAITASDGREALALYTARSAEIAVVLTDMMMPVMDGPSLILALRKLDPTVKVIATSGLPAPDQPDRPGVHGADLFLPKPFSAEGLLLALRQVLELCPASPAPPAG